ncbi:MAG TPA: C4-type zinc ribbon domain-containing protein [Chloroflexia bacterium]|nr:C4-type zinc ribbon domain-containing protein [Chloroflexia bacterium]
MSRTSALYELQQVDSGLDSRVARMRQIDESMGDREDLVTARAQHEEIAARLAQEQATLKNLSHEAEDTGTRLRGLDRQMYDGSIKNPKELGQMQEEASHLRVRVKTLEDSALDVMLALEETEDVEAEARKQLETAQHEQELYHASLIQEKDKLMGQAKVLQVKRQRSVAELPWADLQLYERMRRSKGGVAVVEVRNSICGGCHSTIPVSVLRQARNHAEITTCPTCGRIIYPLGEVKYEEFDHNLDNVDK